MKSRIGVPAEIGKKELVGPCCAAVLMCSAGRGDSRRRLSCEGRARMDTDTLKDGLTSRST